MSITSESSLTGTLTLCSGAVISFNWILTAARCVTQSQVYRIRFGAITHYTGGVVHTSNEAYIHPNFNPENNTYDAALIRFTSVHSVYVTPVILPFAYQRDLNLTNRLATISGWGLLQSNWISPVLRYGYGQLIDNSNINCRRLIGNRQDLLCASTFNEIGSSCPGDIGSPLVVQLNRTTVLVGITIFSSDQFVCNNTLNLFTNILDLRRWMSNVTGTNF